MVLMNNSLLIVMVVALGVTFVSMVLHELMHGLTAYWLGDDTAKVNGRLSLNPIKHIDPYLTIILPGLIILSNFFLGTNMPIFGGAKPVPFNPNKVRGGEWGAALVAIAGPLTNLVLAFICFILILVVPYNTSAIIGLILYYGMMVNLGFFAFNILPIPPLDGSRVMDAVEHMGLLLVFLIVMVASPVISGLLNIIINGVLTGFSYVVAPFGL